MKKILFLVLIIFTLLLFGCAKAEEQTGSSKEITEMELSTHNNPEDCWIVYEGKVYDYSNSPVHPNMAESFYQHCGNPSGFEEGAKERHKRSSEERVSRYGNYLGDLK